MKTTAVQNKHIEEEKMVQKRCLHRGHEKLFCWVLLILSGVGLLMPGPVNAD
jgi:hypothetical protein